MPKKQPEVDITSVFVLDFPKILITLIGPLALNIVLNRLHTTIQHPHFCIGCCFTLSHLLGINCALGMATLLPFFRT